MDAKALAALRSELECPVCLDLPIDKILQCMNTHTICEQCYDKLPGIKKKCPQGNCNYNSPDAARSRIAEKMIERCNFDFCCKYNKNGCAVVDKKIELPAHESDCLFRNVPCPGAAPFNCLPSCQDSLTFNNLEEHIKTEEERIKQNKK